MSVNQDFSDLLSESNAAGAKYLVVGGYALAFHGHPRFTKDLDIFVEPTAENAARVFNGFKSFGVPLQTVTVDDFAKAGLIFQIGVAPIRIEISTTIDGVSFDEAWSAHIETTYDGNRVPVIGKAALIQNKRASGRKQDLVDVEVLENADNSAD